MFQAFINFLLPWHLKAEKKTESKPTKNSLNSLDKGNTTYNYNTENEPGSQKTVIIKWTQKFPYIKVVALQFDAKGMCIRIATAC